MEITAFLEFCDRPQLGILPQLLLRFLWFSFRLRRWFSIRIIIGLRRWQPANGRTLTTAALLRETASFNYSWFNFFHDVENEIGEEFTLRRRRCLSKISFQAPNRLLPQPLWL